MKNFLKISSIYFALVAVFSCGKVGDTYKPTVVLNITLKDDLGNLVNNNSSPRFYILTSSDDYQSAFIQKGTSTAGLMTPNLIGNGVYEITITNPQKDVRYYIYVNAKDGTRNLNLSNFGISGPLNQLPTQSKIYIDLVVKPDDGNLVFFTTAINNMPIEIKVGNYDLAGTTETKTLTGIYAGQGTPSFQLDNISSLWFNKDPGKYSYYAKSSDGCVWTGVVTLEKGKAVPIDLTKCPAGKLSFYTEAINSNLLPITVTINGQNLAPREISSITNVTTITSFTCASTSNPSVLNFIRSEGIYNYFASSFDGKCVWTGTLNLATDECKFVNLNQCE